MSPQVRREQAAEPIVTFPHFAPKAEPVIVKMPPPRGEDDVGEMLVRLGVKLAS